ncbi:co-chaperone GroES [Bdellovibrio sp. HCB290]|uniref:co-chaperone GroES n=1 Tax=Bdellovibrio sp. HCB290 TaxID=3394356 RepID=UPI0039B45D87
MAKKKSSVKKAVKKTAKKVVKKTASKVVKKASKKSPAKKASAKKSVVKKSPAKKAVVKAAKKTAKKIAAKPAPKKAGSKAAPKKSAMAPANKQVFSKPVAKKAMDLTDMVTPLDDRLIVQTSGTDRTTASGLLYIPDTVADVSGNLHGTVVAVGRGHVNKKGHLHPMELKVGDKVVFSQYSGSKIKIQNEDLVILRETEVMGVVEK